MKCGALHIYIYIYVAGTFGVYFVPPHTNVIKRNSICIYTIHISKYVYMCVQVQQKVAIFPFPLNLRSVRFLLQEMLSPARANARQFELWAEESSSVNCVVFHPCKPYKVWECACKFGTLVRSCMGMFWLSGVCSCSTGCMLSKKHSFIEKTP